MDTLCAMAGREFSVQLSIPPSLIVLHFTRQYTELPKSGVYHFFFIQLLKAFFFTLKEEMEWIK